MVWEIGCVEHRLSKTFLKNTNAGYVDQYQRCFIVSVHYVRDPASLRADVLGIVA